MSQKELQEMSLQDLQDTLALTIKSDNINKCIVYFGCLSIYTYEDQFNILLNAPSSTGKSYIAQEITKLFPKEDIVTLSYCSPTSFFHEASEPDEDGNYVVDLANKIILFLDQPHADLLARLRPVLSHDEKELEVRITDKNQKGGNRTKKIIIKGYPTVLFCTAGGNIDEQETSRCFVLSPEVNVEKIMSSLNAIADSADPEIHIDIEQDEKRIQLKKRIQMVKDANIKDVYVPGELGFVEQYIASVGEVNLRPTDQRGIKRVLSLVKMNALNNFMHRKRDGDFIYANETDIEAAFTLWSEIAQAQVCGLSTYTYGIFQRVIKPLWETDSQKDDYGHKGGATYKQISAGYYEEYGVSLNDKVMKQHIAELESAGLVALEKDFSDSRRILIVPTEVEEFDSFEEELESVWGNDSPDGGVTSIQTELIKD